MFKSLFVSVVVLAAPLFAQAHGQVCMDKTDYQLSCTGDGVEAFSITFTSNVRIFPEVPCPNEGVSYFTSYYANPVDRFSAEVGGNDVGVVLDEARANELKSTHFELPMTLTNDRTHATSDVVLMNVISEDRKSLLITVKSPKGAVIRTTPMSCTVVR